MAEAGGTPAQGMAEAGGDAVQGSGAAQPAIEQQGKGEVSRQWKVVDRAKPWLLEAAAQAQELRRAVVQSADSTLQSTGSQLLDLHVASSHHIHSFQELAHKGWIKYGEFEDMFFQKLKEGLHAAVKHPTISISVAGSIGLLLMRRPRRFLFRHTVRRFWSEESLLEDSEERVKKLQQSVDLLKNESKKLEERVMFAEQEVERGQTKLRQAGKQVQSLVSSIYKTEGEARSLNDSLRELSSGDSSRMRAEVATMASEAKQHRMTLIKRVRRIAGYGIPV